MDVNAPERVVAGVAVLARSELPGDPEAARGEVPADAVVAEVGDLPVLDEQVVAPPANGDAVLPAPVLPVRRHLAARPEVGELDVLGVGREGGRALDARLLVAGPGHGEGTVADDPQPVLAVRQGDVSGSDRVGRVAVEAQVAAAVEDQ